MKKIILLAAAALMTVGCDKKAETTTQTGDAPVREVSSKIAYVRMDSLMSGYAMYNDLSSEFEAKAKAADNDITSRGRALERRVADAQNKVERGLVTRAEAAQLQESLAREEQSLMRLQGTKQEELAEENAVMMNKIIFSIEEFMADYNKDYRYGLILSTSGGAPILHADPMLDITDEILKGLNEKYAAEKGKGEKKEAAATE